MQRSTGKRSFRSESVKFDKAEVKSKGDKFYGKTDHGGRTPHGMLIVAHGDGVRLEGTYGDIRQALGRLHKTSAGVDDYYLDSIHRRWTKLGKLAANGRLKSVTGRC